MLSKMNMNYYVYPVSSVNVFEHDWPCISFSFCLLQGNSGGYKCQGFCEYDEFGLEWRRQPWDTPVLNESLPNRP